jgi:sporulation protein YlmC with PRC-barrel domain
MKKTQITLAITLIVASLVLTVARGRAQLLTASTRTDQIRASDLIGKEVRNAQEEHLGKVQDLIIDYNSDHVPYAIISHGGTLGINRTRTAVPMDSLKRSADGKTLILPATKEELRVASKVASGPWAPAAAADWAKSVDGFYGQPSFARSRLERDRMEGMESTTEKRMYVRDPAPKGAELLMTPADSALCEKICAAIDNVQVSVQNGTVKLSGTVENAAAKQGIETKVKNITGVQRVENNLRTKNPGVSQ